jgi:hypothetical protein
MVAGTWFASIESSAETSPHFAEKFRSDELRAKPAVSLATATSLSDPEETRRHAGDPRGSPGAGADQEVLDLLDGDLTLSSVG